MNRWLNVLRRGGADFGVCTMLCMPLYAQVAAWRADNRVRQHRIELMIAIVIYIRGQYLRACVAWLCHALICHSNMPCRATALCIAVSQRHAVPQLHDCRAPQLHAMPCRSVMPSHATAPCLAAQQRLAVPCHSSMHYRTAAPYLAATQLHLISKRRSQCTKKAPLPRGKGAAVILSY